MKASDGDSQDSRLLFGIIVGQFNELVELVDEMEESDPEEYEKYKGAVNKMLDRLRME